MKIRINMEKNSTIILVVLFCLSFSQVNDSFAEDQDGIVDPVQEGIANQLIAVIGIIAAAGVGAVFTWLRERQAPPSSEQDKLFNEIVEQAYFQSYLSDWRKLWGKITEAETTKEAEEFIEREWNSYLGKKLFPATKEERDQIKNKIRAYAWNKAKRSHLRTITKNKALFDAKMENIFNNADVAYYKYVNDMLPDFVARAVTATGNQKRDITDHNQIEEWEKDALKKLMRLLIFAFGREDTEVLRIMIKSEINKIVSERLGGDSEEYRVNLKVQQGNEK